MMVERLSVEVRHEEERVVVALGGEIDYSNVGRVRAVLVDVVRGPQQEVVVDMGDVGFVDSTVLGILVQAKNRLQESGRTMVLENLGHRVRRTFELAGALSFLEG
jgi:anti-anti-sigma factor